MFHLNWLLPYEFSPTVLVTCLGAGLVYARGLHRSLEPVGVARPVSFYTGLVLIYIVLQTQFDYVAQHMFYIHRIQHLVLHHIGPFLVMLAVPGGVLAAGLPEALRERVVRPFWRAAPVRWTYRFVQQPVIASLLFVGLIALWLTPAVHFDAMLSLPLYKLMNWSMVVDGLLFWWLMVNPRPGGARTTIAYGRRIVMLFLVMWPQIVIGAYIALSKHELYDIYAVCGRLWPITPAVDQQLGGLITWIPAAMMSVVGILVVLRFWVRQEAREDVVS